MSKISELPVEQRYSRPDTVMAGTGDRDRFTDLTFKVGKCLFPVHRCVMFWNSPVLEKMFLHETADKYKNEIELKDVEESSFRLVLDYMYSGEIIITSENVIGILAVCDYLEMESLRSFCVSFLFKILKPETSVEVYQLAYWFNEEPLKTAAQKLIAQNLTLVQESVNFCTVEELLSVVVTGLSVSTPTRFSDEQALILILEWIKADYVHRVRYFENLAYLLNPETLTIKFLRVILFDDIVKEHPDFRENLIQVLADKLETMDKADGRLKQTFHDVQKCPENVNIFTPAKEYVQDVPWELNIRKSANDFGEASFSVYAYCNRNCRSKWSCNASLRFRLIPARDDVKVKEFKVENRRFTQSENSWGFHRFMSWKTLMNPENGYVSDEGHVTLELIIHADPVVRG